MSLPLTKSRALIAAHCTSEKKPNRPSLIGWSRDKNAVTLIVEVVIGVAVDFDSTLGSKRVSQSVSG